MRMSESATVNSPYGIISSLIYTIFGKRIATFVFIPERSREILFLRGVRNPFLQTEKLNIFEWLNTIKS